MVLLELEYVNNTLKTLLKYLDTAHPEHYILSIQPTDKPGVRVLTVCIEEKGEE